MASTIAFFNNKGGVGKTTLTANIASYVATKFSKRVLVIDCDPQCNVTQLFLGDEKVINLYWGSNSAGDIKTSTIINIVQPILDGGAEIDAKSRPIVASKTRFGTDLLPGHPRFSTIEDALSRAWGDLTASKVGGFRITNWLGSYISTISDKYDYIFVDVSPSLGSINRSVLFSCDYFVTPLGSDIFSLIGIRNIAHWVRQWVDTYERTLSGMSPEEKAVFDRYLAPTSISISKGFIGYTLQQYITKSKQGVRRATVAFEKIIQSVPDEVSSHLGSFTKAGLIRSDLVLGDVPNLFSIIPLAQSVNAPIFDLKSKDGLVGAQYQQAQTYSLIIEALASQIVRNVEHANV